MKELSSQNKDIRTVGDRVLKAVRMSDSEIDAIVTSPEMFTKINKAVKLRARSEETQRRHKRSFDLFKPAFPTLRVFASVVIAILTIFALFVFRGDEPLVTVLEVPPVITDDVSYPVISGSTTMPVRERQIAAAKKKPKKQVNVRQNTSPLVEENDPGEFQAITFAGDQNDDGRIVRVDLPRASLYAMGVDIPVENASEKVKTDLLIGSDGVMRAVRLVKMD